MLGKTSPITDRQAERLVALCVSPGIELLFVILT
jgi:hypothetical protein